MGKNKKPEIELSVPLLIRLFEFVREGARTDVEIHKMVENLIECSKYDHLLTMDEYDKIVKMEEPITKA